MKAHGQGRPAIGRTEMNMRTQPLHNGRAPAPARRRAAIAAGLAAALLSGLGLSGCGHAPAKAAPAPGLALPPGTPVVTARLATLPDYWRASGVVEARNQAVIAARVSGYITSMRVDMGDAVRRGEVLARLATPEAQDQVRQAAAGLAALNDAVAAARQQSTAAQAQAQFAANTYRRFQRLQAERAVSAYEFEKVATAYHTAAAASAAMRARLAALAAQRRQARAALAQSRTMAAYAVLRAPFTGVVTAKDADSGALANPGEPLLTLAGTRRLRLVISVPDQVLARLRRGEQVQVQSASRSWPAPVEIIAPASDPATHAAQVKLALPTGSGLRPGEYATAEIPLDSSPQLWLPRSAVIEQGGLSEIYRLNTAGRAELGWVRIGQARQGEVQVLAGLSPGTRVVAHPEHLVDAALAGAAGASGND